MINLNLNIIILIVAIALPSINNYINSKTFIRISFIVLLYSVILVLKAVYIHEVGYSIGMYFKLFFYLF